MLRRLPVVPTIVVLIAVAIMIRLGFWQLDRLHEKRAQLALYEQAQRIDAAMTWPRSAQDVPRRLFHQTRIECLSVAGTSIVSGRSRSGESGMAHKADCRLAGGGVASVVLGWSRDPSPRVWSGGTVSGTIAPGPRLVADPPLAGLEASAQPDPRDIPNNHLAYAVQWFLFAGVALVIYALAARKRFRKNNP